MAGWRGIYCDTPCPAGRWGPECGLMCQCHNDGVCHHVTGENCLQYDQKQGQIQTLLDVTFQNYPHWKSKYLWMDFSGECSCAAGWKGQRCEVPCDRGQFGLGCSYQCDCDLRHSEGCDHVTGQCICKHGWKGDLKKLLQ